MNKTFVSISAMDALTDSLDELTPEMRKAARFVIDNPQEVGVSTVREIAVAAQVSPNTFVRMARHLGFDGYDDFRQPFREAIRNGAASFPDRARWLQDIQKSENMGTLYGDMVSSAIRNIEETFSAISLDDLSNAAKDVWNSRNVFTLGVGVNNSIARNFTYLASTSMVQFHAIPRAGSTASDDLAWADEQDLLIAITNRPYRREVVDAVRVAKSQGMKIIGISDSPSSPVVRSATHGFVVGVDTPQFFPSSVSIIVLLETLLSFVISSASGEIVERVEKFHQRRHELGIYQGDDE